MPKDMIITTVSNFEKIKLIKIQLIGMWQKAMMKFAKLVTILGLYVGASTETRFG
ncbi:hypothetical protein G9A89_018639 [Geosiphon pyriformis]|nr:hypothetical protein G9A89_018639 [Geosiphon pyriformis]